MTEMTMIRRGDTLVPSSPVFLEDLHSIPEGGEVMVNAHAARHLEQHRLFFSVLGEMIKGGLWEGDRESLLDYLKIGIGHVTTVVDPSGASWVTDEVKAIAEGVLADRANHSNSAIAMAEAIIGAGPKVYFVPRSISFANLGQDKFNDFFRRVEQFAAERMGVDIGAIVQEIMSRTRGVKRPQRTAKPAVAEPPADPLDTRLAAFAIEMSKSTTAPAAFDLAWEAAKLTSLVKALYREAPEAVQTIVAAARKKALGKMMDGEFSAVVNTAIDDAMVPDSPAEAA